MKLISEIIQLAQPKKINSERAEQVSLILEMTGEDNTRFKYWLGRTRHLSPQGIYLMLKEARNGREPVKLFQWLLNKSKTKSTQ